MSVPAAPASRKLFVTTALPYANGPFHIGHIMEYIQADIWVRFQRMQGHEVHFVCADDAHGAPIMLKAQDEGIAPEALIARVAVSHVEDWKRYHISFDTTHSTHSPENVELAQGIYRKLRDRKPSLIATKTIEQFYDPVKGMFLADRYIKGTCPKCGAKDQYGDACEVCGSTYAPTDLIDPYSTLTGARPELRPSEHLFFRLSDPEVVAFLERWTKETPLQPEVFNKIQEWLGAKSADGLTALNDWDISREAPYFGIDIPEAPGKYFYVWLDAPIGYLAALKKHFDSGAARRAYPSETRSFEQFVADPAVEQYHFIGKDIVYFHTLFWPAMLRFSERKTPSNIFVHGFITFSGEKMSKSRGTGISPQRYIELGMNPEWLRYYIAAKLNDRVEDLDFNPDDFVARVNSDLVGKYVNIASRISRIHAKNFDSIVGDVTIDDKVAVELHLAESKLTSGEIENELFVDVGHQGSARRFEFDSSIYAAKPSLLLAYIRWARHRIGTLYDRRQSGKAIREIMGLVDATNEYVNETAPWQLSKSGRLVELQIVVATALNAYYAITAMLCPVLPEIARKGFDFLQLRQPLWDEIGLPFRNHKTGSYTHLVQRVDPRQMQECIDSARASPPASDQTIGVDEFLQVEIRVGRIAATTHVADSFGYLDAMIDIGESVVRKVRIPLTAIHTPDYVGKMIAVLVQEPGERDETADTISVLMAYNKERPVSLIWIESGAAPGMRIR